MFVRFNELRSFVARLALASTGFLIAACDGSSVAPVAEENISSEPTNLLAYECSTRAQNGQLADVMLTPLQMLNTLEYAFNPALKSSLAEFGFDVGAIFSDEAIAGIAPPRVLGNLGALHDVAAEFMDFRRQAEGLCDLSLEACASDFIAHFHTAFNTRPLTEVQLQEFTIQFSRAPEETLAEIAADNILVVDLAGLNKSEIAAIRLSLLLKYRLPGHDYQQWMEHYPLGTSAGRTKLADVLLNHSKGFKSSVAEFFGDYFFYRDVSNDGAYRFPDETLDTLYLQVLGTSSPVFKGTFADIFNSNMALVAQQHIEAYHNEGAINYGPYLGVGARRDQAFSLFQTETRPGVFSQLAMLNLFRLDGYSYERAFSCSRPSGGADHYLLYGDPYIELLEGLDTEESAQGFEYPKVYRVARAVEVGDETLVGPPCSMCHLMPLSIDRALLIYGEDGERRSVFDAEGGITLSIETHGQFYGDDELIKFDDLTDFFSQVVETKIAKQCFVSSWVEKSLQVPDEFNCEANSLYQKFDASGGHIRTLILEIIASDLFTSNGQSL